MLIIPVIDLKDGLVVSALQGQRDSYQPIQSKLCASSFIDDVLNGFTSVYPFKTIYIADLNSISNSGTNKSLIDKIISENQHIEFWIDNGTKIENLLDFYPANYKPVIGSENQNGRSLSAIKTTHILSLDFFPKQGYKGPKELIENSALWPQNIIIMTLSRVGNNKGADIEKLKSYRKKFPEKNFIAAGGIQNESDLTKLEKIDISQTLIASAIHSGKLTSEIITKWQTKKCPE